jgi:hypothetical protein
MALVVHVGNVAHTHPIPFQAKKSIEADEQYRKCIAATGTLGSTVRKVDNGTGFVPCFFLVLISLKL